MASHTVSGYSAHIVLYYEYLASMCERLGLYLDVHKFEALAINYRKLNQ